MTYERWGEIGLVGSYPTSWVPCCRINSTLWYVDATRTCFDYP